MSTSSYLAVLAKLCLLVCFVSCSDESQSEVIDLQELLKDVSSTLNTTKQQLKDVSSTLNTTKQQLKDVSSTLDTTKHQLKDVTSTLETTKQQLKEVKESCGAKQDIVYPLDCYDILKSGKKASGVYLVQPLRYEEPFAVYCDQITDGGGWTVFQRREDFGNPEDYFFKTWEEYKQGFGKLRKEFWLGNDKISALSVQRNYQLRIDLQTTDRNRTFAKYKKFSVENEQHGYQLQATGYSGTAGDSMVTHHNKQFSTKDKGPKISCAKGNYGAWWYNSCHNANLNGLNLKGANSRNGEGIVWIRNDGAYYSLYSEMKMKPTDV